MMKNEYKGVVALILSLLLLLSACSDNQEEPIIEDDNVEVQSPEVEEKDEEGEGDNYIVLSPETNESEISNVMHILEEGFEGIFSVEYEEDINSFTLRMVDEDLFLSVVKTINGEYNSSIWDELFLSIANMSRTISDRLNDPEIFVIVVHPLEPDYALMIAQNGLIVYDFFEEFEKSPQ